MKDKSMIISLINQGLYQVDQVDNIYYVDLYVENKNLKATNDDKQNVDDYLRFTRMTKTFSTFVTRIRLFSGV